jgi:hypothetical protein
MGQTTLAPTTPSVASSIPTIAGNFANPKKAISGFRIPSNLTIPAPPSRSSPTSDPSHSSQNVSKPKVKLQKLKSSSPSKLSSPQSFSSTSSMTRLFVVPSALLASLESENVRFPICLSDILDFPNIGTQYQQQQQQEMGKKDPKLIDKLFTLLLRQLRLVIRAYIRKVVAVFRYEEECVWDVVGCDWI